MVASGTAESGGPAAALQKHPVGLVLVAVLSVQFGGALAATLLPLVGVAGSVLLRMLLAAVIMLAVIRPRWRGRSPQDWVTVVLFAAALTAMNLCFYASLQRLPIGVAVTIEFLGPLLLAAATSRRGRDVLAVILALAGVVLISEAATVPWAQMDLAGIGLAAAAGGFWACYIVLSGRTGTRFEGLDGMAITLTIASVAMLPLGVVQAGTSLLEGEVILRGLGIALLSSAIPYSLELLALRRLSAGVFGVLLSLEPAAAALAGLLVLSQTLTLVQVAGMVMVVCASIAVLGRRGRST